MALYERKKPYRLSASFLKISKVFMLLKYSFTQRVIPEMLPIRCQSLNKYACILHKYRLLQAHFITQTLSSPAAYWSDHKIPC